MMMSETATILLSLTLLIASTAAFVGALYWIGRFAMSCPKHLQWHFITALVWTATTGIWTAVILTSARNCLSSYFILLAAGSVFIASWRQLFERRRGETTAQAHRNPFLRLFVQTQYGPVLVFVLAFLLLVNGQQCFESSVARGNMPMAIFLRDAKIGDPCALQGALYGAVDREDIDGVRMYLKIGVPVTINYEDYDDYDNYDSPLRRAVELRDTTIARLLLDRAGLTNDTILLQHAVDCGQVEQARLLLDRGADRKAVNNEGLTPFQVAKHHGDKAMTALLLTTDGKVE